MTAAYRLKGVGWFGTCVAVVLGFYLISLQVAAERKKLDGVDRRIASAERDIRALQTEFETRANLAQLEKWNGDTLALAAPTAGQFVADEAQLASLNAAAPGDVRMQAASLVVPAGVPAPVPAIVPAVLAVQSAPAQPRPVPAATVRAASVQTAAITAPTPRRPATPIRVAVAAPVRAMAGAIVRTAATSVAARPQVAMLDRKLLSENTLGDILSGARREARLR